MSFLTEALVFPRFRHVCRLPPIRRYDDLMAPKPNPEMDKRVKIPLDPELAISALLRVDPDAPPADDAVDEMERESFPASDPPSSWAGPDPG